jgi:predicted transcriptional regulator YheO
MSTRITDNDLLAYYAQVAKVLGEMFAPVLEAVVHDLRKPNHSIIAIYNGHITGRKIGDGTSDLGYRRLKGELPDEMINYENESPIGRKLKSSTLAIRNKRGKLIGTLSLNMDVSYFEEVSMFLGHFVSSNKMPYLEKREKFYIGSPRDDINAFIKEVLLQKNWIHNKLGKTEKKEIIRLLYSDNFFSKRSAVSSVADILHMSRPTVYRYVRTIQ